MVLAPAPRGNGYEIHFERTDPELASELARVRQSLFAKLGRLDFGEQELHLSRKEWAGVKAVLDSTDGVVWEKDATDVVTIGVRNLVHQQMSPEPPTSGRSKRPKKRIFKAEVTRADISEAIRIAKSLRSPEEGRLYRRYKIWFNMDTKKYEYRGQVLYCKGEDRKMLTKEEVRDWMRQVNSSKMRKRH